ncbi:MAG: hypothetical protein ACLTDR_11650 [Adlercreutzia equolifaciens]
MRLRRSTTCAAARTSDGTRTRGTSPYPSGSPQGAAWSPGTRDSGNKLQPWEQAERIRLALTWADWEGEDAAFHSLPVRSDDAEPGTISAQRDAGVNARAAQKGGMRDRSYRFLQSVEWVIDPARCPRLAKEVREMQYAEERGRRVAQLHPRRQHDHGIDSVRYAMMREARSRRAMRPATEGQNSRARERKGPRGRRTSSRSHPMPSGSSASRGTSRGARWTGR